jgi:hypothetical protein
MRRAFAKSLAPAGLVALCALLSAGGAFSEDAPSGVAQIATAAIPGEQPAAKNLNSVPIDGLEDANGIESSRLVRQLTAARPNEDLVICIAGCFSGRDRVVYAQPIDRSAQAANSAPVSVLNAHAENGASDGTSGDIIRSLRASQ